MHAHESHAIFGDAVPLPTISSRSSDGDPVNEALPNSSCHSSRTCPRRCLGLRPQKFIRSLHVLMRVRSSMLSRSCCCAAACLAALPSGSQSYLLWQVRKYQQSTRLLSVWAYPLLYLVNDAPMAAELEGTCVTPPCHSPLDRVSLGTHFVQLLVEWWAFRRDGERCSSCVRPSRTSRGRFRQRETQPAR